MRGFLAGALISCILLDWTNSSHGHVGHLNLDFEKCSFRCGTDAADSDNGEPGQSKRYKESCPQTAYVFPRRSSDYIRVKTPIAPIDEFSLCTWAKIYGTGTFWGTIMSYSTPSDLNHFLILFDFKGSEKLYISALGEVKQNVAHPLKKGDENFMCFVIGRTAGFAKVYYNATLNTVLSFDNRNPIPSGGAFIIGQEQDSYLGGFELNQAIHGEIQNYMIWDRILSAEEISKMYRSKCDCAPGHTVSLLPDEVQLEGGVNALSERNECE